MPEEIQENNFEQEVALISKAIESRRNALEREQGIVEEKEIARGIISEKIKEGTPPPTPPQSSSQAKNASNKSYLDVLDEENAQKVSVLILLMREKGIKKAILEARENDPYVLDAFHDALVDKLYDELKKDGYI